MKLKDYKAIIVYYDSDDNEYIVKLTHDNHGKPIKGEEVTVVPKDNIATI